MMNNHDNCKFVFAGTAKDFVEMGEKSLLVRRRDPTKTVSGMSDEQLRRELAVVQEQITVVDCFGLDDLVYEQALIGECAKRGLE